MKKLKQIISKIPILNKLALIIYNLYHINTIKQKAVLNSNSIEELNLKLKQCNKDIQNLTQQLNTLTQQVDKVYKEIEKGIEIEVRDRIRKVLIEIENINKSKK